MCVHNGIRSSSGLISVIMKGLAATGDIHCCSSSWVDDHVYLTVTLSQLIIHARISMFTSVRHFQRFITKFHVSSFFAIRVFTHGSQWNVNLFSSLVSAGAIKKSKNRFLKSRNVRKSHFDVIFYFPDSKRVKLTKSFLTAAPILTSIWLKMGGRSK